MNIPRFPIVGALLGVLNLASVSAATINIQFGQDSYIGPGAARSPNAGIYWNYYDRPSHHRMLDLKDALKAETEVVIFATYQAAFGGGPAPTTDGGKGRNPGHLLGGGIYGPIEFDIVGLDPEKSYDVYAYVSNKNNEPTTVTLTDANGTSTRTPSPVNAIDEFRLNQNYVVFSNIAPQVYGRFSLTVEGAWTGLNGLQIVESVAQPPQAPPTVQLRSNGGTIETRHPKVTLRGTSASDVGIRAVWISLDRDTWRKARGTSTWNATVRAGKRTRVFVRAEDVNGEFSPVEFAVIVPQRRR